MSLFNRKSKTPNTVDVKGHGLACSVCDNRQFYTRRVQLNTTVFSFFGLDWLNQNATCFVCSECTQIIWFNN